MSDLNALEAETLTAIAAAGVRGLSSTQALPPASRTRAFTVAASWTAAASLST